MSHADEVWRERAACRGMDPRIFIYAQPGRVGSENTTAKRVCEGCPVNQECGEASEVTLQLLGGNQIKVIAPGIWGGKTYNERKVHFRSRRRAERGGPHEMEERLDRWRKRQQRQRRKARVA